MARRKFFHVLSYNNKCGSCYEKQNTWGIWNVAIKPRANRPNMLANICPTCWDGLTCQTAPTSKNDENVGEMLAKQPTLLIMFNNVGGFANMLAWWTTCWQSTQHPCQTVPSPVSRTIEETITSSLILTNNLNWKHHQHGNALSIYRRRIL